MLALKARRASPLNLRSMGRQGQNDAARIRFKDNKFLMSVITGCLNCASSADPSQKRQRRCWESYCARCIGSGALRAPGLYTCRRNLGMPLPFGPLQLKLISGTGCICCALNRLRPGESVKYCYRVGLCWNPSAIRAARRLDLLQMRHPPIRYAR